MPVVPAVVQALSWDSVSVVAGCLALLRSHQRPRPAATQKKTAQTSLGSSSHQRCDGNGHPPFLCHLEHLAVDIYVYVNVGEEVILK